MILFNNNNNDAPENVTIYLVVNKKQYLLVDAKKCLIFLSKHI